jgi:8-oxo-dGTP pyrophosphatase MutT (NUDIX family)
MSDLPYRAAAGVMLLSPAGQVFVAQRIDTTLEAWQMPQGGLDPGEDAEAGSLCANSRRRPASRRTWSRSLPARPANSSTISPPT